MANFAKIVHDKISPDGGSPVMHSMTLDGVLNSLSVNKDCSQVVVAGRSVFKVFGIGDDSFTEKLNLRAACAGHNPHVNFISSEVSDVAWNSVDDNILASAMTNGAVVTWNLSKSSRNKQDQVFKEYERGHERSVTRVSFHASEHHLLISCSLDGKIKIFDLRQRDVANEFKVNSEVRDVQFSPHSQSYFQFAAAFDSGNVQIWDFRSTHKPQRQFTAHTGLVFSLDWHPEERNWLATAGRDKLIKVWDLQNPARAKETYTIQTITTLRRVKWRPQRRYHIASCALLVDFSINVWDVRRPYIPFATFEQHKDTVTGIEWKPNDPHVLFSIGKDSHLCQHIFRDAVRPADTANRVGLDINLMGSVLHASSGNQENKNPAQTRLPSFFRRVPDRSDQFTMVTSLLSEYGRCEDSLDLTWLVKSAEQYKLTGAPLEQLCLHNAKVAEDLQRSQIASAWRMLQTVYSDSAMPNVEQNLTNVVNLKTEIHKDLDAEQVKVAGDNNNENIAEDMDTGEKKITDTVAGYDVLGSEEESDLGEPGTEAELREATLATIASGVGNTSHSDYFFGDGDVDPPDFDFDTLSNISDGQEWSLPNEAITIHQDFDEDRATSPGPLSAPATLVPESPSSATEIEPVLLQQEVIQQHSMASIISTETFVATLPQWHVTSLVSSMLQHYADKGDVQMAVSVVIVLGDKIRSHIDQMTLEHWFMSYIDVLARFRLWSVATEVINLAQHPVVSALNQQSTTYHTTCGKCGKRLQRAGWLCDRCKGQINTCSICHQPVKGLFAWCQGCSHGGHLHHMRDWLKTHRQCPTGCGHTCEYT